MVGGDSGVGKWAYESLSLVGVRNLNGAIGSVQALRFETSAIGTAQALRFAAVAATAVRGTASATRLPSRSFAAR